MGRRKNNYIFFEEKKKRHASGCLILVLAILFAVIALGILSNSLLNQQLKLNTEKVRIMNLDAGYENVTILHISDLHGGSIGFETELWKQLLFGKGFTAVVMTGDMVGAGGDFAPLVTLIKTLLEIKQNVPIYFIAGDEDPAPVAYTLHGSPEPLAEWVRAAQAAGAIYLDRAISQQVGKKTVWFIPEYLYSIGLTDDAGIKGMVSTLTRQKAEMEASGKQYEAEGGASYRALSYRLEALRGKRRGRGRHDGSRSADRRAAHPAGSRLRAPDDRVGRNGGRAQLPQPFPGAVRPLLRRAVAAGKPGPDVRAREGLVPRRRRHYGHDADQQHLAVHFRRAERMHHLPHADAAVQRAKRHPAQLYGEAGIANPHDPAPTPLAEKRRNDENHSLRNLRFAGPRDRGGLHAHQPHYSRRGGALRTNRAGCRRRVF